MPIQWITVAVLDGVTNIWRRYIYLVDVQAENEALRTSIAELRSEVSRREEARLENVRLHRLLALTEPARDVPTIVARVVSTAPTPLFRSIRVDRGSRHGVHTGAAVVGHDGVIGRVAAVAPWSADVMLLIDANNSLAVLVQRTRARARVRGKGGDQTLGIEVEYLGRTEDVEPGDILITSGTGTVFPKGVTVGTIISVERRAFGLNQEATAEPSVDFGRIEEVMIIPRGWPVTASFEEEESAAAADEPADEPAPGHHPSFPRPDGMSLDAAAATPPDDAAEGRSVPILPPILPPTPEVAAPTPQPAAPVGIDALPTVEVDSGPGSGDGADEPIVGGAP